MTFNNYLPPKSYAFLVKIAEKYNLSVKEVQRIFINRQAAELGFNCDHKRKGFAKTDHKPFCKDCWARMEIIDESVLEGNRIIKRKRYSPLDTFLDIYQRENSNQKNVNEDTSGTGYS